MGPTTARRRHAGAFGACRALAWLLHLGVLPSGWVLAQCPDGSPPPCRAQPARAAPALNSVAVLYFDNLSADTGDAYLADGLTEAIIVRLSQVERLAVKSRNAVQRFRGRSADDPTTLGRALGISYLVNGSVRRAGTRVRLTVNLVRASSGLQLWGEQYDRESADVLAIEEDVARAVATAIAGRLLPGERASLAARPTRDPQAYDHFLRGNYALAQRNPRALTRAISEYEAAARLDPAFAVALARIAYAYGLYLDWAWEYPGLPAESVFARGRAAAERALREDSTASDAWMAIGYLRTFRDPRTFENAQAAFERAIALDPRNAEAHHQYASILRWLGEDAAAAAAFARARALDPERAITLFETGLLLWITRRFAEAQQWYDSVLVIDPGAYYAYFGRAWARIQLGDGAGARFDAEAWLRSARGARRFQGEATLALVDVTSGDSAAARARVERMLTDIGALEQLSPYEGWPLAAALVALGDWERALDVLERLQPRGAKLWFFLRASEFDPIRSHPRFQRLVEESRPAGVPR